MSHSNSHLSFGLCLTHRHTPLTFHLLWIGIIQFTAPDGSSLVTDLYGGILHVLDFLVVSHRGKGTSMQAPRALLLCISPAPVLCPSASSPLGLHRLWSLLTSVRWRALPGEPRYPSPPQCPRQEARDSHMLAVRFRSEITALACGLWNVWKLFVSFILLSFPVVLVWGRVKFSTSNTMRQTQRVCLLLWGVRTWCSIFSSFSGYSPCGGVYILLNMLWQRMLWRKESLPN